MGLLVPRGSKKPISAFIDGKAGLLGRAATEAGLEKLKLLRIFLEASNQKNGLKA